MRNDGTKTERLEGWLCKWSLEDIPESFHGNDFSYFTRIGRLGRSCRLNNLQRLIFSDRNQRDKVPPVTAGFVQNHNEFRRVQVTCKYFVFPFLHDTPAWHIAAGIDLRCSNR